MIKGIIFDFDGVILDSANIKTEAFEELFRSYTDDISEIMRYHKENSGYSRFIKFEYFFTEILKKEYSDDLGLQLSKKFDLLTINKILKASKVDGIERFLSETNLQCFIATGTPQDDIVMITKERMLYDYFIELIGTPTKKADAVNMIMGKYDLRPEELVFIGDAESDQKAADTTGLTFIPRLTSENLDIYSKHPYAIKDFTHFEEMLVKVEEDISE